MDERFVKQAQERAVAVRAADAAVASDVKEGVVKALTTQNPNQFAMTFVGKDADGKTIVSPYVKKAGRAVILNEVAKKKGGIAVLRPTCVRSSQEDPKVLLDTLNALPKELQKTFMESRGNDFRAFSLPKGFALYKFLVVFKSGEKWEGEGIAHVGNVKAPQLHSRLDEMAETRAFMRCVGRGTADGFISPEQAAGSGDYDAAEAELLAEEQGFEQEAIDVTEAGPDGSDSFRSPDGDGASGTPGEPGDAGRFEETHRAAESNGAGAAGSPADESLQGDGGNLRPDGSAGDGEADITLETLMNLAKDRRIFLKQFVKEQFNVDALGAMTPDQRAACYLALLDR